MERLASRMAYGSASPRDVLQLVATLEHAKPILDLAVSLNSYPEFSQVPDCQGLYNEIKNAIVENPPLTLKEGGVFNDGYNQELDEVRRIAKKGKDFILELEAKERERTGVKSLKVGYKGLFLAILSKFVMGIYQISKMNLDIMQNKHLPMQQDLLHKN